MANNEQSIRITARGEFSQLENGLKNLQKDLKSVLGEIDKGARKGGFFDDTQLRALDVYRTRFKSTMDALNREFQKQNETVDQLYKRQSNASKDMQNQIQKEIDKREKLMDKLRRQLMATEDLYTRRNREADTYSRPSNHSGVDDEAEEGVVRKNKWGFGGGGGGGANMLGSGLLGKLLGTGGFLMGLAGIGGIASMASQSYQLAYNSQVTPMNLSQRLRGNGYNGSAYNMWNQMGAIGRGNQMGYTSEESWNFQDMLSRQIGAQNPYMLGYGLQFGRAYGLDTQETAQGLGSVVQQGGASNIAQVADMVASSVAKSGMTPRILEVLQTSAGLLSSMNTTLKDTGAKQILAYQTTLDTIGNAKGMQSLTGEKGANIIQGLGGIFNPSQSNPWQWMGIQALQQYNPKKYGKMGLYDLQSNFEDGLVNTDNLPAMTQYLRKASGGDENTLKRMIQKWLQDGGYNATKTQVNDLYGATNGFTAFDSNKINGIIGGMSNGDGTAKYQERIGQIGQNILDVNSRFEKQLENLGQPLLQIVQGLKEGATNLLESLTGNGDILGAIKDLLKPISDFFSSHKDIIAEIGAAVAAALIGKNLLGGRGGGGKGGGGGSGGGGGESGGGKGGGMTILGGMKPGTIAKGWGLGSLLFGGFNAFGDKKESDAMAKKAGIGGGTTWFDRFIADTVNGASFGTIGKQSVYNFMNPKNSILKPAESLLGYLFPDQMNTQSKDDKTATSNMAQGLNPDGSKRKLSWVDYLNPANAGKTYATDKTDWAKAGKDWAKNVSDGLKWLFPNPTDPTKGIFDGAMKRSGLFDNTKIPDTEAAQEAKKAYNDLSQMATQGNLNITNLTSSGQKKLQELADQGLVTLQNGQNVEVTTLSGFTDAGKKSLLDLQSQGLISIGGFSSDGKAQVTALSSEGQKKLEDLNKSGKVDISAFHTENSKSITGFTADGLKKLIDLEKNGNASLDGMNTKTKDSLDTIKKDTGDKMTDLKGIHQDLSDKTVGSKGYFSKMYDDSAGDDGFFSKMWKKVEGFFDWWKSIMPKWLGGNGDGDVGISPFGISGKGQAMPSGVSKYKGALAAAGQKYGISDVNLLEAVMAQESGGSGNNPMQVNGVSDPATSVDRGVKMLSDLLKKTNGNVPLALQAYNMGEGFISYANSHGGYSQANAQAFSNMQKAKYGYSIYGDPNYVNNVLRYYPATAVGGNGSGNVFANWQSRITSPFGDSDGRSKPHGGLDLATKQGTPVQALANGTVSFIKMDDGGQYDPDHKANSSAGGNEIGVKMANGETYYFAHLSGGINPQILSDYESGKMDSISAGQWLANSGGTPGTAGSGNDTTGAHLHIGYMGANGVLKDPATLLRTLGVASGFGGGIGDGDVGINPYVSSVVSGSSVKQVEVTVKLEGSGASELNSMTQSTLQKMIQDAIKTYEAQKLLLNPSYS